MVAWFAAAALSALPACRRRNRTHATPTAPAPQCEDVAFGAPAFDALVLGRGSSAGLLYETHIDRLTDVARAQSMLEAATRTDPTIVPMNTRLALHGDVLGLVQRLRAARRSSTMLDALIRAATALATRLTPRPGDVQDSQAVPIAASTALGPGWIEHGSELSSLMHERLFGMRRIFRILTRGDERALVSQLVTVDTSGHAVRSPISGEIERLRFAGDRVAEARVWHLDHGHLRCRGVGHELVEVGAVAHVPADGANGFLLESDTPIALTDLPCTRCHRDRGTMSLPTDVPEPTARHAALLRTFEREVATWQMVTQ